ncbi:hypothetical protein T484DRAFT_1762451 [Baffinella frigidus]|nr:hypothetical protein T484DRAFT_1762451 [Cryptophyta sp. CCMP2293]
MQGLGWARVVVLRAVAVLAMAGHVAAQLANATEGIVTVSPSQVTGMEPSVMLSGAPFHATIRGVAPLPDRARWVKLAPSGMCNHQDYCLGVEVLSPQACDATGCTASSSSVDGTNTSLAMFQSLPAGLYSLCLSDNGTAGLNPTSGKS